MVNFTLKNIFLILLLTTLLFSSLVIFKIFKDKFNDIPPYTEADRAEKQMKKINVETFTDSINTGKSFCSTFQSNPQKLHEKCRDLGKHGCHVPPCCVLLNNTDCVAGDHHGPTFLTELGKRINNLFFHHQGKCRNGSEKCPE
tara:strand:- start:1705 stop:2133 length:429 start_codon:yes stop_codon:yes gene_type:complete